MNQPSFERIIQIGSGYSAAKVLLSAVGLGLFTELAGRPLTAAQIAERFGLVPRPARDFLDALVSLKLLDRDGDGPEARYANTAETAHFLDEDSPTYLGGLLKIWDQRNYRSWADLTEALQTGQAQSEIKYTGTSFFETMYAEPSRLEAFMSAMDSSSRVNFELLAQRFPFDRYRTLCDVGGADALLSRIVANRHPHLQITSWDLPKVTEIAARKIDAEGLSGRVRAQAGSFLTDPLPRADVITMGMILHDWDLERKKLLVAKAYAALPEGGSFIVIESLIDDARRENTFGLMMSLNMLIEFGDAFDYTAADFQQWCTEAGFRSFEVIPLDGPSSAAVAYK